MGQVIGFIKSISLTNWLILMALLTLVNLAGYLREIQHIVSCVLQEVQGANAHDFLSGIRDDVGEIREKASVISEEMSEA
jgi:hypothetical protein